jgi:hypothetical protein
MRLERMCKALEQKTDIARDAVMSEPICRVMLGNAPYLDSRLIPKLEEAGTQPVYALTYDGKHIGFINA